MGHHIVNLLSNLFTTWMGTQYFSMFGEKNEYKKSIRFLLFFSCLTLSMIGSTFVLYSSVYVMPCQMAAIFLLSLLYKNKWFFRLLHTVIYYLLLGLSEMFIGMVYNVLFDNFVEGRENVYVYCICAMTARLIAFLILRFIKLFAKKQYTMDLKNSLLLLPLPFATLFNMYVFIGSYYKKADAGQSLETAVFTLLLVLANVSVYVFIDRMNDYVEKKTDLMLYEQEYKAQKQHIAALQEHLNETRTFRHDTKNTLLSLIGLMNAGETEKVLNELKRSLNILDENGKDIVNSGHPILDALLQNKLRENKPKGIVVKPIIKITDELLVNEVDMGILLGNIVDNAIEATERLEPEKRIPIEVRIISLDGLVSINVRNAVDHEVDTENLRTIKKDKLMHGYGVKQIKKTVAKYDGTAEFVCKDNVFTVTTTMANRPRQSN